MQKNIDEDNSSEKDDMEKNGEKYYMAYEKRNMILSLE